MKLLLYNSYILLKLINVLCFENTKLMYIMVNLMVENY